MNTELFLEGYPVDISTTLSSLLTFALDDVKDFASRQTTFSQTIILPGTARNNALFGNIFETGISNEYDSSLDNVGYNFNASKSARCLMFQNNLQTFKGTLRLLQINKDRGRMEYEVALNGELTSLNVALSSGFLSDLDFSAYDLTWDETEVVNSWDNPGGSGVYFPLIDFGASKTGLVYGGVLKHDWDILTMRPALYVKEYIDKMFEAANFRYECDLFDTARFKGLIVPHNRKSVQKYVTSQVNASRANSANVIDSGTPATVPLQMSSVVVSSSFTSTISNSRFTFVSATAFALTVDYNFTGTYKANGNGWFVELRKNGVVIPGTTINLARTFDTTTRYYNFVGSLSVAFTTSDYIEVMFIEDGATPVLGTDFINASSGIFRIDSDTPTITDVGYGDFININETLPKNIKQVEFFTSIVRLFNLYVYEDRFDERLIKIAPYVDFFSTDSSNAVDWTYKLDRNQPEKITPLSEINSKTYNFNYKDDSDYWNDVYKKRFNQGYGSYIFDSEYEYASGSNKLELIFASTPLVGYVSEDKVYSTIYKRTGDDTAPVYEGIDSVIRILQTKKITGVSSWDILNGVSVLDSVTDYGYAGHFSDPDFPTDDLNFGALNEVFFELDGGDLSATQFNIYYSGYMSEITNKDSKMLTAKFYLTPRDIFELDFSKYVYVDGVLWRLNKITDYNATVPDTCEVRLLKVINTIY
jgi:hypothetical protein